MMRFLRWGLALAALVLVAGVAPVQAIPSLQLGPGSGSWVYDVGTQTWLTPDNPLTIMATATATTGNGSYAWTTSPDPNQIAYLVISAVPKITTTEPPSLFDVTVDNDAGTLALYTSGNGAPPLSDPNDLAPHGIFSTYFEIYEFNFDGPVVTISDTQPGGTGTGDGFEEFFDITINSLDSSVQFLHFDLFTIVGSGQLGGTSQVNGFAPFSHDAETTVPAPGALGLMALGCLGLGLAGRMRGRS